MMRKTGVLALCVLLLGGCARRVENPGPPQITILEDAVIEVNQPDFSEDMLILKLWTVRATNCLRKTSSF